MNETQDPDEETHGYFAHGSNMDPRRIQDRCPGARDRRRATLPDHRLVFNKATNDFDGSASANLEAAAGEQVEGALYSVAERDLLRIDQIEGHPRHYTRRLHAVLEADGTKTIAWVYHATPEYVRGGLKPRRRYLEHLLAGKDLLDGDYQSRLETMKTID